MHSLKTKIKTNQMDIIREINREITGVKEFPEFKAGDSITVNYKITEGAKTRIQAFKGVVIQKSGSGTTETITVRKISNGVGVERIFPIYSPNIDSIEVNRHGKVRRAKLFYLRKLRGKSARIKEKRRN